MYSLIPISVFFCMAAGFVITMLLLSIVLGPKRHSETKDDPFECGTIGTGGASSRHRVRFYLVAISFILFDLEIAFLYPWAVNFRELSWYGLAAVFPFVSVLMLGLLYEWRRGVLEMH